MNQENESGYPRPQLRRRHWMTLDGPWQFTFDDDLRYRMPEEVPEWPLTIQVPFAPECPRSGVGDTGFHAACWYSREFQVPPHDGDRVLLHFGAVDYQSRVWINNIPVVEHQGGYTPFSADITFALLPGSCQRITVWAADDPHDLEKPRGKQDWRLEPHSIWYPRTTGIWQTVWLEVVPENYIARIRWTPNMERWEIACDAFVEGPPADDLRMAVRMTMAERVLAEDTYRVISGEVHRRIGLSDPGIDDYRNEMLWTPEHPTLIQVEIKLLRDSSVVDEVHSYTALRSVTSQRERILLNSRPYSLRMILDQGYWPDTFMTAPSDAALRHDVELAKAMGFNGVRKHQKIEDPRYLYWCDVLGLAVFEEMPSAYRFTTKSITRLLKEWTEVIERDSSHPCVIMWVPFNESWGVPDLHAATAPRDAVAAFYHLTKTLDPTRLVIGNDGWESSATDVIGVHDYASDPRHLRVRYGPEVKSQEVVDRRWAGGRILTLDGYPHRGQPILLSEFGGIAYINPEDSGTKNHWGYRVCTDLAYFASLVCQLIQVVRTTAMFSGFCYTQFTDTFQEANGLLFADRHPKFAIERIAAAVRGGTSYV